MFGAWAPAQGYFGQGPLEAGAVPPRRIRVLRVAVRKPDVDDPLSSTPTVHLARSRVPEVSDPEGGE